MFKTVDFAVINACAEYMPKMRDDFLFADSLEPVRPAEFYSSDYEKLLHSVFFQVHAFIVKMLRLYGADAAVDVIASYLYVLEEDVGKHPTPISDEIYRLRKEAIASSEELEVNRS